MKDHPLFKSLFGFKGNARGCVYPEPLNGIPVNLYSPYVSVYMLALGMNDSQIGLLVSVGWFFQLFLAMFSGVITDTLGRRKTTLIFDIFAWTIPALISAAAQDVWFFLAATLFTAFYRIPQNSWSCLMVEDADPSQLIDIFTWIYIAGMLSAFFVPLAGLLIKTVSLVPAMRILYVSAAFLFTLKAVITYRMTTETHQGMVRMEATRGASIFSSLSEYRGVIKDVLRTPGTLYTAGILAVMSITTTVNATFWAILATEKIKIPAENLALFPFLKSAVMLLLFFVIVPRLHEMYFKKPMLAGFACFAASQCVLIAAPAANYWLLGLSVLLEACSFAVLNPLVDQMTVVTVDAGERARILSLLYVGVILVTSPFGWIAGQLSTVDKTLPFVLNIGLLVVGGVLVHLAGRSSKRSAVVSMI